MTGCRSCSVVQIESINQNSELMIETALDLLSARKGIMGRLVEMSLMISSDIVRALCLFLSSAFFVCLLHFLFLHPL